MPVIRQVPLGRKQGIIDSPPPVKRLNEIWIGPFNIRIFVQPVSSLKYACVRIVRYRAEHHAGQGIVAPEYRQGIYLQQRIDVFFRGPVPRFYNEFARRKHVPAIPVGIHGQHLAVAGGND